MEYSKQKGLISDPEYNLMDLWHKFAMDKFGDKIKPDLIRECSIISEFLITTQESKILISIQFS